MSVHSAHIINIARKLKCGDDENPEYDRALVALTTELLGLKHETHGFMVAELLEIDIPK